MMKQGVEKYATIVIKVKQNFKLKEENKKLKDFDKRKKDGDDFLNEGVNKRDPNHFDKRYMVAPF